MRVLRWLAVAGAATALVVPGTALANGGAYIALDDTHFLPGSTATAEAYVYVPRAKQHVLDRGPFYAYLLPDGDAIEEGREIPNDAIRVGTFAVERERRESFELTVEFVVPDLPGAFYTIAMCNEPCTVAGFPEPLTGVVSVVSTVREGELLTERSELEARLFRARHQTRKAERQNEELEIALAQSYDDNRSLATMVNDLQAQLEAAEAAPAQVARPPRVRPILDGWAAAIIAMPAAAVLAAIVVRRRRQRVTMPQTP